MACLMVIYAHSAGMGWLPPLNPQIGGLGVVLFFTLSGFLMAYLYTPLQFSLRYWKGFLIRRFFRIYPLFLFLTLIAWHLSTVIDISIASHLLRPRTRELPGYDFTQQLLLNDAWAHFWTIPIEIRFYLIFPIYASVLLLLPLQTKYKAVLSVLFWEILLCLVPIPPTKAPHHPWQYMSIFMGGASAGYIYFSFSKELSRMKYMWNIIVPVCLIAIALYAWPGPKQVIGVNIRPYTFLPSHIFALMILACVLAGRKWVYVFANPISRFLGRISYSLYLIHGIIFVLFDAYWHNATPIIPLGCTLLAASITYYTIEKPFIRLGHRTSNAALHP